MSEYLSIRKIPIPLAKALRAQAKAKKLSLSKYVLGLLADAAGTNSEKQFDNNLSKLAGTWSVSEYQAFEDAQKCNQAIDPELWK